MATLAAVVGCAVPSAAPAPTATSAVATILPSPRGSPSPGLVLSTPQTTRVPTPLAVGTRPPVSTRVVAHVAPPAVGVLTEVDTEVEFLTPLPSAQVIHELAARLRSVPGVLELRGDEYAVTVMYDTGLVTPVQIQEAFRQLGYAVRGGVEIIDPGVSSD